MKKAESLISFIKFGIIGSCGALINLSIYWFSSSLFNLPYSLSSAIAFLVAVTFNYILNHKWTFSYKLNGLGLSFVMYIKYIAVNIFGLIANLLTLNFVVYLWGDSYNLIGQLLGILIGMVFNYLLSKSYVFKRIKL